MDQTNRRADRLLDYAGIAEKLGISLESARAYNSRAVHHRRQAARTGNDAYIRPGDLPEPAAYAGQSPVWYESTIDEWDRNRPGRGNLTTPTPKRAAPKRELHAV